MQQSLFTYDITEIDKVSKIIIESIKQNKIVLFSGAVGSGKTTLIKYVMRELGYKEHVSSPTFSVINEYALENIKIYHMDLYRIKKEDELYEIGFEEYLKNGNLCLIEWPEIAIKMIYKDFIHIKLKEITKTKRSIEIKSL